ncbi:serine hydrolase domain-containing protein [Brevundimonas aveniformis]|uniref:serine hydrolase domain-containing protein n=1 Tax=Brevundimonas aveniformis TaxID=370977 RepID=UPI000418DD87|nr:serine hydrolase domain-containing protein [Brevundimonas aveniformis]
MVEISGICPPRFDTVQDRFAANFDAGEELGARFSVCIDGELVVDLMGGFSDAARTTPFGPNTLTPIFSTTKLIAALMTARLVDQGLITYDTAVAEVWPEFGQAGKEPVTLGQMMSHQAGLPGLVPPAEPDIWFDPPTVCEQLAAQAPLWPLGTGSGYHPITIGYLAGEVFRRLEGRSLGAAFRQDIAEPLGLDIWIGLPDSEHGRVAQMRKPPAAPDLGTIDDIKRAAFLDRGSAPGGRGSADWRRMEIPSANGHATAQGLARLMSAVSGDGTLDGQAILAPETLKALLAERVRGPDKVLPFDLVWAAGPMRNSHVNGLGPGAQAVGHYGWGGSMAMADPERNLSVAYVMNKQSVHLVADPRPVALIEALYTAV